MSLPHADRIEALLRAGKRREAKVLNAAYWKQQEEAAKHGPINLSDLLAASEAFAVDRINREETNAND